MNTDAKHSKDEQLLINAAETIGSTLGAIAARAEAAAKALRGRNLVKTAQRVTKTLTRGKLASRSAAKRHVHRAAGRKRRSSHRRAAGARRSRRVRASAKPRSRT
jgi:hypothetical protein